MQTTHSAQAPGPEEQASARQRLQSVNPATGEVLAEFEPASGEEVDAAVGKAASAFAGWRRLSVRERAACLFRLKEVLYARRDELARLITLEAGKPFVESMLTEVVGVLDGLEYFGRKGPKFLAPQRVPHHNPAMKLKRGRLEFEPYGVIGIISPYNYPFATPLNEMIPALLVGNTVVLKPSEFTPQVGLAIRDLFEAAELPTGVVQVILGDGVAGRALTAAHIHKLIFTGSVATGKRVQAAAAEHLLPTVLELGGKDAMLVLADANLETASSGAVWGAFTNAGQTCISVERAYVLREVAERFIALCVAKAKRLRVGRGDDPATEVGPLIRDRQVRTVEEQVSEAVAQGAQVLCGGRRPDLPGLHGYFYQPTVVTWVNHHMRLMREETFGPVLPIQVVEDEAEAVELANDSAYALSASVWTRNRERGERLARQIEAGAVMVNDCVSYFGISEAPHGGAKMSGIGRTHSRLGLMEMVQVKYLDTDLAPGFPKPWWYGYGAKAVRFAQGFMDFLFGGGPARRVRGLAAMLANLEKKM
jgi:succinate-semialdehyde dehydrogenase/glutarate-semialdehyde dehydrogenase